MEYDSRKSGPPRQEKEWRQIKMATIYEVLKEAYEKALSECKTMGDVIDVQGEKIPMDFLKRLLEFLEK